MTEIRRAFAPLTIALALSLAGGALAEPTAKEREKAAKLAAAGDKAANAGNVDQAIDKHREAWSLAPTPILGLTLGKELIKVGKLVEAQEILFAASSLDIPVKDAAKHKDAAQKAAEKAAKLDEKIGTIEIVIEGGTMDVGIRIDGKDYDPSGKKSAIKVDPGRHVIEVTRGDNVEKKSIEVEEAGRKKLKFGKAKKAVGDSDKDAATEAPAPKIAGPTQGWAYAALGTGIGGLVLGGAGLVVGLTGGNDRAYLTPVGGAFALFGAIGVGVGIYGMSGGGGGSPTKDKAEPDGKAEEKKEKEEGLSVRAYVGFGSVGVVGRF